MQLTHAAFGLKSSNILPHCAKLYLAVGLLFNILFILPSISLVSFLKTYKAFRLSYSCRVFLAPVNAVLKYGNLRHQATASWAKLQLSSYLAIFSIYLSFSMFSLEANGV